MHHAAELFSLTITLFDLDTKMQFPKDDPKIDHNNNLAVKAYWRPCPLLSDRLVERRRELLKCSARLVLMDRSFSIDSSLSTEQRDLFADITTRSALPFIDRLFVTYRSQYQEGFNNLSIFEDAMAELDHIRGSVVVHMDQVLQHGGVGREFLELNRSCERVRSVIQYIEEMCCEAMVDPKGLIDMHDHRRLAYQAYQTE